MKRLALAGLMLLAACQTREIDPSALAHVDGRPLRRERFEQYVRRQIPGDPARQQPAVLSALFDQLVEEEILLRWAKAELGLYSLGDTLPPGEARRQIVDRLLATSASGVGPVAAEEIAAYWQAHPEEFERPEQIRIRQILTPDAKSAAAARARLVAGESFDKVSREMSKAPNADRGGLVGTFARGQLPPVFDEVLFTLDAGRISRPIVAPSGHHVFLVEWHGPAGRISLDEAADSIRTRLLAEKRDRAVEKAIREAVGRSVVEVHSEAFLFEYSGRWSAAATKESS